MTKDDLEDAFWNEGRERYVVRETIESASQRTYDLEKRTMRFGEAIIDFANIIPRTAVTRPLIEQLVGCGTSVGANYCEADDAVSKKEFRLRCGTCKKEAREAKILLADDRPRRPGTEVASPPTLAGSKRTPSDLRENLAKRRMNLISSSFVIRDSSFS